MIAQILKLLKVDNSRTLALNICTAIGAFSKFPEAPKAVKDIVENYWVQWALLAVLIYQGGGEQDVQLAVELTVIIFAIFKIVEVTTKGQFTEKFEEEY
jgi:hypothetical protein